MGGFAVPWNAGTPERLLELDDSVDRSTMAAATVGGSRFMSKEFLGDRKKALEDSFFAKENAKLLEQIRSDAAQRPNRESPCGRFPVFPNANAVLESGPGIRGSRLRAGPSR